MNYPDIRKLVIKELKSLKVQQTKLEAILKQLDGGDGDGGGSTGILNGLTAEPKRAYRGKIAAKAVATSQDIAQAMELVKFSDKKGVNVVKMSHVLRGAGYAMPTKQQMLDTGKAKMIGRGGGSAYVYIG